MPGFSAAQSGFASTLASTLSVRTSDITILSVAAAATGLQQSGGGGGGGGGSSGVTVTVSVAAASAAAATSLAAAASAALSGASAAAFALQLQQAASLSTMGVTLLVAPAISVTASSPPPLFRLPPPLPGNVAGNASAAAAAAAAAASSLVSSISLLTTALTINRTNGSAVLAALTSDSIYSAVDAMNSLNTSGAAPCLAPTRDGARVAPLASL